MRRSLLWGALLVTGCRGTGEAARTEPAPPAPSVSASTVASSAPSAPSAPPILAPPLDATPAASAIEALDAGALDLIAAPFAEDIQKCADEINGPRLGYFSNFLIHVDIDATDAGSPAVTISGPGLLTHKAKPGTCFDRLGQRIVQDPRGRGRHFRIDVTGPSPKYVITQR